MGGHWAELQRALGVEGAAVGYAGDNLLGDVQLPARVAGWRTVAVVEELAAERSGGPAPSAGGWGWGSSFWCDEPSPCRPAGDPRVRRPTRCASELTCGVSPELWSAYGTAGGANLKDSFKNYICMAPAHLYGSRAGS